MESTATSGKSASRSLRSPRAPLGLNSSREWRTLLLVPVVYGGASLVVVGHRALGLWSSVLLLAWFGAWHLSLQHELLHGHPFRKQWVNDALASIPVTLWVPYVLYKRDHLAHHRSDLTVPGLDNESYYVAPGDWARMGRLRRTYHKANRTLLFRMFVNTVPSTFTYNWGKLRAACTGDRTCARAYVAHVVVALPLLWAIVSIAGMPLWQYVLGVTYGGRVLNSIRSFPEHRYQDGVELRTAMVEAGPLLSLLMLNNNLHVPHHDEPWHPWYDYSRVALRVDAYDRAAAAGLHFQGGYWEVVRRYAFRPVDGPVHPSV